MLSETATHDASSLLSHENSSANYAAYQPIDSETQMAPVSSGHSFARIAVSASERAHSNMFLAPVPAPTKVTHTNHNMVIQRAITAKSQVPQGLTTNPSRDATIPDLPTTLVTQLQAACTGTSPTQATDRQTVLTALYNYLRTERIIDNDVVRIEYEDTAAFYGITDFVDVADETSIQTVIKVSSKAFVDGAPIVYSTIRHEAIHAEQMKGIQNKPASSLSTSDKPDAANDDVNYIDRTRAAELNGGGPAGRSVAASTGGTNKKRKRMASPKEGNIDRAIEAMQEIETYVWEIENAGQTGTAGNVSFLTTRYKGLGNYYSDLCTYAGGIGKNQQADWKDYILRAKVAAENVLSALPSPNPYNITYNQKTIKWRA